MSNKLKVYKITDKEFNEYGQVLEGYDFEELFVRLKELPVSESGIVYKASIETLEQCKEKTKLQNKGFGGMPVQIGYVGGYNKVLNCLEYHKSSEFNIALDDIILVLGKQTEIINGKFDTSLCKAFFVPAGCGVELYGTTLHYAPFGIDEKPYRVICVLPIGTNGDKPEFIASNFEDKMCAGSNKWLLAHEESQEAQSGKYTGIIGKNICFEMLEV